MLSTAILAAAGGAPEVEFEIPMAPEAFGGIALGVLMGLLALTFAFRGVSNKH